VRARPRAQGASIDRLAHGLRLTARRALRGAQLELDAAAAHVRRADIAVFHDFAPPPAGGGNQFLRALVGELERRGLRVERNLLSRATRACLCNSYNFDFGRLRRLARPGCRIVHRVDGPIGVYRGHDDGTDRRIWELNAALADATIFQSRYSLERHRELGLEFAEPHVIHNTVDPRVFHAEGRSPFATGGRVRLIATSWSDNPAKGADVIKWLEGRLDWTRFELTFVGRTPVAFERLRLIPPVPPLELAGILREHDVFVTASRHESCSNALLEALACGLPALYLDSGSNAEVAGKAGLGFADREQLPELLERLVDEYDERRAAIALPPLEAVARAYLEVLGL
jgi:glycosyltransferase involved in cell wall biosynthesis